MKKCKLSIMSKEIEEWRPVVGYEGLYEVSDWGNVRSLNRTFEYYHPSKGGIIKRSFKGKVLKKTTNFEGYYVITLADRNHKLHQAKVHRLVAESFILNPENKPVVGHLKTLPNGLEDKTANEAWNLAWMTQRENTNYGTLPSRISERMMGDNNPAYGKQRPIEARIKQSITSRINKSKKGNI